MKNPLYFLLITFFVSGVIIAPGPAWSHGDETHNAVTTKNQSKQVEPTNDKQPQKSRDHESKETSEVDEDRKATSGTKQSGSTNQEGLLETVMPGLANAPDIHPMLVHFPIVFLPTAFLFVLGSWFFRPDFFLDVARWLFWLGLISFPVAAGSGFLAVGGWGGGHNALHRNLMLITTGLAFLLFAVLRYVWNRKQLYRIVMTVGLAVILVVLTVGADQGAWLVYVEGSGVKPVEKVLTH